MWVAFMLGLQLVMYQARSWKWFEPSPPWWQEQTEELRQEHEVAKMQTVLLRRFEKTRDAAGCRERAEMWEKLNRTDAVSLYNAACYRAVTAAVLQQDPKTPGADATRLAREEADRAMVWLKQAVAAGYKNAAHVAQDRDLDALRDREDFKQLVAELEAGPTLPKPAAPARVRDRGEASPR